MWILVIVRIFSIIFVCKFPKFRTFHYYSEILDIILSVQSQNRDEIIEQIHNRLQRLKEEIVSGLLEISFFQIFKVW